MTLDTILGISFIIMSGQLNLLPPKTELNNLTYHFGIYRWVNAEELYEIWAATLQALPLFLSSVDDHQEDYHNL